MSLIADARSKGFIRGAACITHQGLRIMTSGRIKEYENGNLQVMCQSPFFIRWRGGWVAEVMKKNTKGN